MNIGTLVERYPALALAVAAGGGLLLYKLLGHHSVYPELPPAATVNSQQAAIAYVSPEMLANAQQSLRQQIEEEIAAQQNQYYQQYQSQGEGQGTYQYQGQN